jgi:transcriptional regulator with XRE-family HTH domain
MEIYEKIVSILKDKNISKRDFAKMLIEREVRSSRTGEVLSEKVIYAYLNGTVSIRADIIFDICSALGITEQELYDDSESKHIKLLHKILKNPTDFERQTAMLLLKESSEHHTPNLELDKISKLLEYAPPAVSKQIIATLQKYKEAFEQI